MTSRSEISALITLIKEWQKAYVQDVQALSKAEFGNESLLQTLKNKLGTLIYTKHCNQFYLHSNYSIKIVYESENAIEYNIFWDGTEEEQIEEKARTIT